MKIAEGLLLCPHCNHGVLGIRGSQNEPVQCADVGHRLHAGERWVGTCRREWLDHVMVLNHKHLQRLLQEFLSSNKRVV